MKRYMYIKTNGYDMIAVVTENKAYILTDSDDTKAFGKVYDAEDKKEEAKKLLEIVRDEADPTCWGTVISSKELYAGIDRDIDADEVIAEFMELDENEEKAAKAILRNELGIKEDTIDYLLYKFIGDNTITINTGADDKDYAWYLDSTLNCICEVGTEDSKTIQDEEDEEMLTKLFHL